MRQLAALYTQKKKKKKRQTDAACRVETESHLSFFLSCLSAMMPNLGSGSLL